MPLLLFVVILNVSSQYIALNPSARKGIIS
jgi:hypothetical protein